VAVSTANSLASAINRRKPTFNPVRRNRLCDRHIRSSDRVIAYNRMSAGVY